MLAGGAPQVVGLELLEQLPLRQHARSWDKKNSEGRGHYAEREA